MPQRVLRLVLKPSTEERLFRKREMYRYIILAISYAVAVYLLIWSTKVIHP